MEHSYFLLKLGLDKPLQYLHFLLKKQNWILKGIISCVGTIIIVFTVIYNLVPKPINYSDPELIPLWKAVKESDRISLGFTPVPKESKIRIEKAHGRDYDIMLHIYHTTSRTIAFKHQDDRYHWIGEQEIYEGPNEYSSPDGTYRENIALTYHKEKMGGFPVNRLHITYNGDDPRLKDAKYGELTLEDVKPILKEWNY